MHPSVCHAVTLTQVSPMVEAVSQLMNPATDVLFLAKTSAYERPGQLAMRSRRMFVQVRVCAGGTHPTACSVDLCPIQVCVP